MVNLFAKVGHVATSIFHGAEHAVEAVAHGVQDVVEVKEKVDAVKADLGDKARAAFLTLAQDLIKAIRDSGVAVTAGGLAYSADAQAFADVVQLVNDAKAAMPYAQEILADLGLKI